MRGPAAVLGAGAEQLYCPKLGGNISKTSTTHSLGSDVFREFSTLVESKRVQRHYELMDICIEMT